MGKFAKIAYSKYSSEVLCVALEKGGKVNFINFRSL